MRLEQEIVGAPHPTQGLVSSHGCFCLSGSRFCVRCSPLSKSQQGHPSTWDLHDDQCQVDGQLTLMYWYRQLPGQSRCLMATANQGSKATYERGGFTEDKFPISRPDLAFSTLTVSNAKLRIAALISAVLETQCWARIKGLSKNPLPSTRLSAR